MNPFFIIFVSWEIIVIFVVLTVSVEKVMMEVAVTWKIETI